MYEIAVSPRTEKDIYSEVVSHSMPKLSITLHNIKYWQRDSSQLYIDNAK